jgi:hypothetical protein
MDAGATNGIAIASVHPMGAAFTRRYTMPDASPRLPFEIDDTIDPTLVTGRAGVPLVIELFRQLGVAQTIDAEVAVKQRQRGLPPSELVESLIVLWASGGDRCQDLTMLREDQALATLLGHPLPAATTMRDFLEAFHVADGPLWAAGPAATIPVEPAPLAGLGRANRTLIAGLQQGARVRTATLDVDATLVESHKDAATVAYDGTRGYQPVVVLWAEQDVILHDQFRDGHVPAGCGNVRVLEQAVANLPQGITQIALRADSALYETAVLRWCEEKTIAYAISADLSEQLRAEIVRLPETAWRVEREEADAIRTWAEVAVRPERWGSPEGSPLYPAVPGRPDPEAPRESLRRREQRPLLRGGDQPDGGWPCDSPVASAESGHGGTYPSRPQARTRGRRAPEREVRGERRLVPVKRPHLQSADRAQAVDLTRRSPDRPAEAAAVLALQHRREGRRACPADAPPALGGPAACLTPPGPSQDRAPCARLAGD